MKEYKGKNSFYLLDLCEHCWEHNFCQVATHKHRLMEDSSPVSTKSQRCSSCELSVRITPKTNQPQSHFLSLGLTGTGQLHGMAVVSSFSFLLLCVANELEAVHHHHVILAHCS